MSVWRQITGAFPPDLEAAFLFPWAVSLSSIGIAGWAAMMLFLAELALGYVYAWKNGALEWE